MPKTKTSSKTKAELGAVTDDVARAFETGGICIRLRRGAPGFRAGVDSDEFEAGGADKDQLSLTKKLIDSDAFRAIKRCHNDVAHYLRHKAMPVPSLDQSYYFVPTRRVKDAIEYCREQIKLHDEKLVPAFIDGDYENAKREAKKRLKHLYNEEDYPSKARLREAFYISIEPQARSAPTALRSIDADLYLEAQREIEGSFRRAAEEARLYLRQELLKFLKDTVDRLTAKADDGRPKAFHSSSVEKIEEFVKFFDDRNVLKDGEMQGLVERLRKVMKGVDVEAIRDDAKFRAQVAQQMGQFTSELDKLVTAAPRKIKVRGKGEAA